jgi:spermidine synthase
MPGIFGRAIVAAICLLPPTLMMGATLPAMSRWVETTPSGVSWLGYFYGGNIAGAVLGSLLAGFYLLRMFDMTTATFVAIALNILVASIGLWLAGRTPHEAPKPAAVAPLETGVSSVYVAIAISGMTALIMLTLPCARSIRLWPGFLAAPAVMITMSASSAPEASLA